MPDEYARQLKHGYLAAISFVDAQVGRLLDELERLEMSSNTIIVLWGDHGWKLGEHDAWAKHSNVENDTRVPLIVSVPGMPSAGRKTASLVELVDVYPTLAELAGLPAPDGLEGLSFKPVLDNPTRTWKTAAFSQFPRSPARKKLMGYTMRTNRYRLTSWVERDDVSKVAAIELYDHINDPQENTNIAGKSENEALVQTLSAQWRSGWQAAMPK
jgi:arylsulfatase A-like enzyme